MKRRVFLSLPFHGRDDEDVMNDICHFKNVIKDYLDTDDVEVIHNFRVIDTPDNCVNQRIYKLGEALKRMSTCDSLFITHNFEQAHGCFIEHTVAVEYGMKIFYIKDGTDIIVKASVDN